MTKWMLPLTLFAAGVIISIYGYFAIPGEVIVTHFGPGGEPNGWMGKAAGLTVLPAVMLFVTVITNLSTRLETNEDNRQRIEKNIGIITSGTSLLLLVLHALFVAYNQGFDVSFEQIVPIVVGLLFIAIGNVTPRLPQGSMNLPKIPETAYRKMALLSGRVMVIAGILTALSAFAPSGWQPAASIGTVIVSVATIVAITIYQAAKA